MIEKKSIAEQIKEAENLTHYEKLNEALAVYGQIDMNVATDMDKAVILNNKGVIYKRKGDYQKAEDYYNQALAYHLKNNREPLEEYLLTLNNLALNKRLFGNYTKSEKIYHEILTMAEQHFGRESEMYYNKLNNLGALYMKMGQFGKAEECFCARNNFLEKTGETGTLKYALALFNLATLYKVWRNKTDTAIELYRQSIKLMQANHFTKHTHYYRTHINLCFVLMERDELTEARLILESFLADTKTEQEASSLDHAKFLLEYAKLMKKMLKNEEALRSIDTAIEIIERTLTKDILFYSELLSVKATILSNLKRYDEAYTNLLQSVKIQNRLFIDTAFAYGESDALEFLRAINNEYNLLLDLIRRHFREEAQKVHDAYLAIILRKTIILEMTMIQNLLLNRSGDNGKTNEKDYIHGDIKERLKQRDYTAIIANLDDDSLFFDIYHLDQMDRYILFIISSDETIRLIDLGKASSLNKMVEKYRESLTHIEKGCYHQLLSTDLYRRFFSTLQGKFPRKIIISTANELSHLPFDTIKTTDNRYLIEETDIRYISTIKDFEAGKRGVSENEKTFSLITNPDFDYPSETPPDNTDDFYKRLPGSRVEGETICQILGDWEGSLILNDAKAVDANFKRLTASHIVHIATHGFFSKNPYNTNPLKDSGLIFAGINAINAKLSLTETEKAEIEDGKMTAYDLTFLDLKGTELIVLSACETGLGKYINGNGVIGLQRAILLSGVRKMIMTLWKSDDDSAISLMKTFYNRYRTTFDAEASLREAKLQMIKENRQRFGNEVPALWGGYVCLSRSF